MLLPADFRIYVLVPKDPQILPKLWQIRGYNFRDKEEVTFPPGTYNDTSAAYQRLHEATRTRGWAWYLDELPEVQKP